MRGVGTPARASSAEAKNLSIVRSIARGPLTTVTPRATSACSTSTRKITCSSEPRGMPRTITASQPSRLRHRDVAVDAPDHARHRHEPVLVPARRERVGQLLRVPAAARPEDRDGQPQKERSSTSRLTRPASKLRPLPTLVSLIWAGLKSSGSIA